MLSGDKVMLTGVVGESGAEMMLPGRVAFRCTEVMLTSVVGGADVTIPGEVCGIVVMLPCGEVALSSGEVMMPGVVCEGDADVTFTRDATVLNKR